MPPCSPSHSGSQAPPQPPDENLDVLCASIHSRMAADASYEPPDLPYELAALLQQAHDQAVVTSKDAKDVLQRYRALDYERHLGVEPLMPAELYVRRQVGMLREKLRIPSGAELVLRRPINTAIFSGIVGAVIGFVVPPNGLF